MCCTSAVARYASHFTRHTSLQGHQRIDCPPWGSILLKQVGVGTCQLTLELEPSRPLPLHLPLQHFFDVPVQQPRSGGRRLADMTGLKVMGMMRA